MTKTRFNRKCMRMFGVSGGDLWSELSDDLRRHHQRIRIKINRIYSDVDSSIRDRIFRTYYMERLEADKDMILLRML